MEQNKFLSDHVKHYVLTLTYENPYSENNFERNSQDNISPYNQAFEHPEE